MREYRGIRGLCPIHLMQLLARCSTAVTSAACGGLLAIKPLELTDVAANYELVQGEA